MKKKIAPVIILLLGAVIIAALVFSRKSPETRPAVEIAQRVVGITLEPMTVVPRVTTYGEVKPDRTWIAAAQVSGKVVWKAPKLKDGEFTTAGDTLLRIDDREFTLALNKAAADINKIKAVLAELETNQVNIKSQLDLLSQAVTYNEKELERQQNLYESKAVAASTLEQQRITVLDQQRSLAALQATFDALPAQIDYQKAELASAEAAKQQAELDLEHTVINAPFDGRFDKVSVEIEQFISAGQTLLELDSIAEAEVTIGLSPSKLAMLAGTRVEKVAEVVSEGRLAPGRRRTRFDVFADNGNGGVLWQGRFSRISASIDPETRMMEMVVAVDKPYERPVPGKAHRPPLSKGTFCTVIMYGQSQPERIVVPRQAVHEGKVYVANAESRLEIRDISVAYFLGKYAILDSGLSQGEILVTSDIIPAVSGMLLEVTLQDDFSTKAAVDLGEADDA